MHRCSITAAAKLADQTHAGGTDAKCCRWHLLWFAAAPGIQVELWQANVIWLPPAPTSALVSSARRRHLERMSPTAGPPSTLTISAVLPPSSETGSTWAILVVKFCRLPAVGKFRLSIQLAVVLWESNFQLRQA